MKNNSLTKVLTGVLMISALLSLAFCYLYIKNTRDLRALQWEVANMNNNRMLIQALANDVLEYSKTNPAITPILNSVGITNRPPAR